MVNVENLHVVMGEHTLINNVKNIHQHVEQMENNVLIHVMDSLIKIFALYLIWSMFVGQWILSLIYQMLRGKIKHSFKMLIVLFLIYYQQIILNSYYYLLRYYFIRRICVWLPTGKCSKFQQCSNLVSSINEECILIGCMSGGTRFFDKQNCIDYHNEIVCKIGIDGVCVWNNTSCTLMQCYDFQYSSHEICQNIMINQLQCTTKGNNCIPISNCQSYNQFGCYIGIDGECFLSDHNQNNVMIFQMVSQILFVKLLTNNVFLMVKIVLQKAECKTYNNVISCNGGEISGQPCFLTPTNQDKYACNSNKSCFWNSESECLNHTCETLAKGQICRPVPNFNHNSYIRCILKDQKCIIDDPLNILNHTDCQYQSAFTYTWNSQTLKCQSCLQQNNPEEDINNQNESKIDNQNETKTNNQGSFLIIPIIIFNLAF
ncbi:unnamed protein product [Paramecium sonneborni]|uniref:Transmembrane protein n=1 Tax=Paramecium sonneborni TaxID=65129 RepID=A0A8S1RQL9_9CILI|nr:unnamed protein product [Paramecium sonneborni]